ncbi:hypothetical protein LZ30DRAFT_341860 [Colletotrichum cereale]|nr:hypothetical protein LZ30DRAFT_341860 [Colletotrichum cereale]
MSRGKKRRPRKGGEGLQATSAVQWAKAALGHRDDSLPLRQRAVAAGRSSSRRKPTYSQLTDKDKLISVRRSWQFVSNLSRDAYTEYPFNLLATSTLCPIPPTPLSRPTLNSRHLSTPNVSRYRYPLILAHSLYWSPPRATTIDQSPVEEAKSQEESPIVPSLRLGSFLVARHTRCIVEPRVPDSTLPTEQIPTEMVGELPLESFSAEHGRPRP